MEVLKQGVAYNKRLKFEELHIDKRRWSMAREEI